MKDRPEHQLMQNRSNADQLRAAAVKAGFSSVPQAIQRVVLYPAGQRDYVINQAETVKMFRDYGTTFSRLNATELNSGNAKDAIVPPVFRFETNEDQSTKLSVAADAINAVSYRMDLPSASPWETDTDIQHVNLAVSFMRGYEPVYPFPVDPATNIRLTVEGAPDDGTFATLVERHEDVHLQDNYAASREMLEPWDEAIHDFRMGAESLDAPTPAEAEAAFYTQIGNTPSELGKAFYAELHSRGDAFHQQDDGKGPTVDSMRYNKSTKHFILKLRHTMG